MYFGELTDVPAHDFQDVGGGGALARSAIAYVDPLAEKFGKTVYRLILVHDHGDGFTIKIGDHPQIFVGSMRTE